MKWPDAKVVQVKVEPNDLLNVTVRLRDAPEVFLVEIVDVGEYASRDAAIDAVLKRARHWVYKWPRLGAPVRLSDGREGTIVVVRPRRAFAVVEVDGRRLEVPVQNLTDMEFPHGPP